MATKRDHVWAVALALARDAEGEDGPSGKYGIPGVTVDHVENVVDALEDVDVSRRMVRDTLNGMAEVGVLAKREGKGRAFSEFRLPRDHPLRE